MLKFRYNRPKNTDRKNVQIASNDSDHRSLRLLAMGAGESQGNVLHLLMRAAYLRTDVAIASGEVDPETLASPLELYLLLVFRDMDLITAAEFQGFVAVASMYPGYGVHDRVENLAKIINQRLEVLQSKWLQRREELKESKWNVEKVVS